MMKKYIKLISLAMAVLMLVLAIPFAAIAKTLTTTEVSVNSNILTDNNLLMSLEHLGASPVTGEAADGEITLGDAKCGSIAATSSADGTITVASKSNTWYTLGRATNLPLQGNEEYTITYSATLPDIDDIGSDVAKWSLFGFLFNLSGSAGATQGGTKSITLWHSIASGDPNTLKVYRSNTGADKSTNFEGKKVSNIKNFKEKLVGTHDYIVSIKGKDISVFIDGEYIGTVFGDEATTTYISDGTLALGMRIYADASNVTSANTVLCNMNSIKVYKGAYYLEDNTVNNYKDGDTLLKLKTPLNVTLSDENYNGSEFSDLVVTQNKNMNVWKADGTSIGSSATPGDDDTIYTKGDAFTSTNYWFEAGATTNLPLNEDSKYTIEFYMKNHQAANKNLNVGFIFDIDGYQSGTQKGIYYFGEEDSISTLKAKTLAGYKLVGSESTKISCADLWTKYADADGYTRFSIEIDGTHVTVFVGGQKMGTFDFDEGYTATTLSLAVRGHVLDNSKLIPSDAIVSVKDVTVYAGHVESACRVNFEKDGAVIGSVKKNPGETLTAADFPTVENTDESKFVKWFYKGTNIIVTAPYTLTHDITLEARIVGNGTEVAGMQFTDVNAENKQNVRFLATLNSLQGTEVGFEIDAVYIETENGEVKEHTNSLDKAATTVYSSIKAADSSGTVKDVTAKELGGAYLIALSVNNVPDYTQVDFYVRAYVTVDGEKLYSGEACFILQNGKAALESAVALERP